MSVNLNEAQGAKINDAHKLHLSKIQSNQRILKNLVAKRLRLDIEIQNLTRAIRRQTSIKNASKRILKEAGIEMESSDVERRLAQDPETLSVIESVDKQLRDIRDLLLLSDEQTLL